MSLDLFKDNHTKNYAKLMSFKKRKKKKLHLPVPRNSHHWNYQGENLHQLS
jgi:hypothetical protein